MMRTSPRLLFPAFFALLIHGVHTIDIPFGDVNVLVLTDTHSWVSGHGLHEPDLDADYGDVLSFYERIKSDNEDRDLWFVVNGDFVHGTGLSTNPPKELTPILREMNWDAINIGNHELEQNETVQYMMDGYIASWGQAYITSNVVNRKTHMPLGRRYRLLHGKHSTLLVFGFLYDMPDASPLVMVEPVEHIATTNWFVSALRGHRFDAILVLAHMDLKDPLVDIIRRAIRMECGQHMPIQFITGHTHYRGYQVLDAASTSFEAGRYLDTVGFVSFPTRHTYLSTPFQHLFLNANKPTLEAALPGGPPLSTEAGLALSKKIRETQVSMGLLDVVGCSPRRFYEGKALERPDSLWGLYLGSVVPSTLLKDLGEEVPAVFLQSVAWSFRYDICAGNVTVTDIASVVTVDEFIYRVASNVPGRIIRQVIRAGESGESYLNGTLPSFAGTSIGADDDMHVVYTVKSNLKFVLEQLESLGISDMNPEIVQGNRTIRSMWTDFVSDEWSCQHSSFAKDDLGSPAGKRAPSISRNVLWTLLVGVFLICSLAMGNRVRRLCSRRAVVPQEDSDPARLV